jgi:uncharacterized repeat protein (TIGR03843 family)
LLPYSSNYTLLATVTHNGVEVLAVYKPRRGERPLWDFPHGTLFKREVAAYVVSDALGFGLVPPTVVREGPYGVGALQFFIHSDQDAHLLTMQREGCFEHEILQLAAFDCLINNADRKSGHCLKGDDNRLWAIDHGIAFHVEYKLRTVLWDFIGMPFPADIAHGLRCFLEALHRQEEQALVLADLLDAAEMRALRRRTEALVKSGVYPEPGPGPNVPWPPV